MSCSPVLCICLRLIVEEGQPAAAISCAVMVGAFVFLVAQLWQPKLLCISDSTKGRHVIIAGVAPAKTCPHVV